MIISLQPNVRLTSNQAVFLSLSVVLRSLNKLINLDPGGALEGLLSARVPQHRPRRVNFSVHLGVHEGTTMTININVFRDVQRGEEGQIVMGKHFFCLKV